MPLQTAARAQASGKKPTVQRPAQRKAKRSRQREQCKPNTKKGRTEIGSPFLLLRYFVNVSMVASIAAWKESRFDSYTEMISELSEPIMLV